ncbi:MAG TPA: bifunctional DNA-formamidopyrimidine glycosylase/DNA-(apurinic or apyrimidinic site) lyase [Gemmatimonadaceae bacterium]
MPELPEVERAAGVLRAAVTGRRITALRVLHPAQRKRLRRGDLTAVAGHRVTRVERRGKHQLLHLDDGATVHVHFRMTGDWEVVGAREALPRHTRAVLDLDDGSHVALVDMRALATLEVHPPHAPPILDIGPDAADDALTPAQLHAALATRRLAIKQALLDQRVLAGVGNIYAAESLWRAKVDPRRPANAITRAESGRLLRALRFVLRRASGTRYYAREGDDAPDRFDVYGKAGEPCPRCGTAIARTVQGGRSTYFCPRCQSS